LSLVDDVLLIEANMCTLAGKGLSPRQKKRRIILCPWMTTPNIFNGTLSRIGRLSKLNKYLQLVFDSCKNYSLFLYCDMVVRVLNVLHLTDKKTIFNEALKLNQTTKGDVL
jgi:hypothetical protein